VASEAIRVAERDGRDVVLVDTAGRMQDNEPLMRALSSLIHVNNPNLVLFVGEALVGNDAVDQLVKFNRWGLGGVLGEGGRPVGRDGAANKLQVRPLRAPPTRPPAAAPCSARHAALTPQPPNPSPPRSALHDLAPAGATRAHMIDGIVLTKFDTIDDKVGAALSMVYTSGAPVMFVGCGQTYVDLKKLNVRSVVRSLLK
jgi:signal recognition particle receptor subunit alpha